MRVDLATGDSLTALVQHNTNSLSSVAVAPEGTVYVAGSCANTNGIYNGTPVPLPR